MMNCHFWVKGIFKQSIEEGRILWEKDFDEIIKKHNFKKEEKNNHLFLDVTHCEEIFINLSCRVQNLEFIYYGDDLRSLSGIFEFFWMMEPYLDEFDLKDDFDVWNNIIFFQKRNTFPNIDKYIEQKVTIISQKCINCENELVGIAKWNGQSINFQSRTISILCNHFSVNNHDLDNAEVRFIGVIDYLLKEAPLTQKEINLVDTYDSIVVKEDVAEYLSEKKINNDDTIGIFKSREKIFDEYLSFSFQSQSGILGWIISKEIWVLKEGAIVLKFADEVWYCYQ